MCPDTVREGNAQGHRAIERIVEPVIRRRKI
jgi:hypothetical protein